MRRVRFVDDRQSVLDGLQALLRKQRRRWGMLFGCDDEAALVGLENGAGLPNFVELLASSVCTLLIAILPSCTALPAEERLGAGEFAVVELWFDG